MPEQTSATEPPPTRLRSRQHSLRSATAPLPPTKSSRHRGHTRRHSAENFFDRGALLGWKFYMGGLHQAPKPTTSDQVTQPQKWQTSGKPIFFGIFQNRATCWYQVGCLAWIRTMTNRSRICSATVTPRGKLENTISNFCEGMTRLSRLF